jgi:hypothetical protein
MLPSAVNDTMRDMMSQIRDVGDGIRGGTYTMTAPVITGGSVTGSTINNSAIGGTTAAAGKFTTLEATGATTFSGATVANTFSSSGATMTGGSINGAAIGATTPSTVKTTALTVTGATSGTLAIEATAVAGTNTATFPAATGTVMVSGNMPAFSAYGSANQGFTSGVTTKITLDTEVFDTNSNFASSRFTPTVAGYYQINGKARITGTGITNGSVYLYKNGSQLIIGTYTATGLAFSVVSAVVYLDGSTDYIELYGYAETTVGNPTFQAIAIGNNCEMTGSLVRSA